MSDETRREVGTPVIAREDSGLQRRGVIAGYAEEHGQTYVCVVPAWRRPVQDERPVLLSARRGHR